MYLVAVPQPDEPADTKNGLSNGTNGATNGLTNDRRLVYPYWSWKPCLICQVQRPPRVHHCPLCRMCVLKRDHHCFFTGSCVGEYISICNGSFAYEYVKLSMNVEQKMDHTTNFMICCLKQFLTRCKSFVYQSKKPSSQNQHSGFLFVN